MSPTQAPARSKHSTRADIVFLIFMELRVFCGGPTEPGRHCHPPAPRLVRLHSLNRTASIRRGAPCDARNWRERRRRGQIGFPPRLARPASLAWLSCRAFSHCFWHVNHRISDGQAVLFSAAYMECDASNLFPWNWGVSQFHKRLSVCITNQHRSGSAHRRVAVPCLSDTWKMTKVAYGS